MASIDHTAYMTAATHIHASTAQLQLCVLKQSSMNWLCTQKTDEYNEQKNLGVCQINVYTGSLLVLIRNGCMGQGC